MKALTILLQIALVSGVALIVADMVADFKQYQREQGNK